jgi:hypothetical protein
MGKVLYLDDKHVEFDKGSVKKGNDNWKMISKKGIDWC